MLLALLCYQHTLGCCAAEIGVADQGLAASWNYRVFLGLTKGLSPLFQDEDLSFWPLAKKLGSSSSTSDLPNNDLRG